MDLSLLLLAVPGVLAALALPLVLRARRRRLARRRAGYELIDCLKAYSAWVDWHRDEPQLLQEPEAVALPATLVQAGRVKDQWLPELSPLMRELLRTHRELMRYFREEENMRMSQAASPESGTDRHYHQLRDAQEAALDNLFMRCRQLIGDAETGWQRTRSDFSFSSGLSLPQRPSPPD